MNRGRSSFVFLSFAAIATVACPLAAGCMAEESDGMVSTDESSVGVAALALTVDPDDPPFSHNPFPPTCFWDGGVQQTYRQLATGPLVNFNSVLPAMPVLPAQPAAGDPTEACRYKALKYLAQCALPQGAYAIDPVTGKAHEGHFGLAPLWRTQPLDVVSAEWMTSCLAAHLNNKNVTVSLLFEANRSGYYVDADLESTHPDRDTIAWGNIFFLNAGARPQVHVCYFDEFDAACTAPMSSVINNRMCDQAPGCGVVLRGNCNTACTWGSTGYWGCNLGGSTPNKSTNFRIRLEDFSMYMPYCIP